MIVAIVAIVAVKNVFVWLSGQLGASLQEYVTRDLRDDVFRHLQRLPLGYFQRTKAGQIISRVLADTEQTKALITELVTRTLQNLAQIVGTIVILLKLFGAAHLRRARRSRRCSRSRSSRVLRKLRKGHRRLRGDYGEITSVLQEVVSGVRLVKSFGGEPYEDRRFAEASHRYSSGMVRITRVASLSQPMTEMIGTSVAMLILWIGAREVLAGTGTMDSATLITFMIMVMRLLPPLKQLSQTPTTAQQSFAAAERLFEVLDLPTEQRLDRGTREVTALRDTLAFERVSFAYDDEPVLRDVSFVARRGDVVALVGASGAGKSTLVDLIPRFYEPTSGRDPPRRRRHPRDRPRVAARAHRHREPGHRPVQRHRAQQHRVRGRRPVHRRAGGGRGARGQRARLHRRAAARATTPSSASGARGCRAASASASPSRARSSPIRPSSSSTRPRRRSTPNRNDSCKRPSTASSRVAPSSSSPTVSRPSCTQTRFSYSTGVRSSSAVPTPSSSRSGGTYHRLHAAQLRRDDAAAAPSTATAGAR